MSVDQSAHWNVHYVLGYVTDALSRSRFDGESFAPCLRTLIRFAVQAANVRVDDVPLVDSISLRLKRELEVPREPVDR